MARALSALRGDGWSITHSVDWAGRGDIDHLVRGHSTVFAVETKTARYSPARLERVAHQARWLSRRRRAQPVLVLCAGRRMRRYEGTVLVVSIDELVGARCATSIAPTGSELPDRVALTAGNQTPRRPICASGGWKHTPAGPSPIGATCPGRRDHDRRTGCHCRGCPGPISADTNNCQAIVIRPGHRAP